MAACGTVAILTQRTAAALAAAQQDHSLAAEARSLRQAVLQLQPVAALQLEATLDTQSTPTDDWATLIAEGSTGVLQSQAGVREVVIRGHRYTPRGLLYDLEPEGTGLTLWQVPARDVRPIHGRSQLIRANLVTGERRPVEASKLGP